MSVSVTQNGNSVSNRSGSALLRLYGTGKICSFRRSISCRNVLLLEVFSPEFTPPSTD
jgi:hypothetical protein